MTAAFLQNAILQLFPFDFREDDYFLEYLFTTRNTHEVKFNASWKRY